MEEVDLSFGFFPRREAGGTSLGGWGRGGIGGDRMVEDGGGGRGGWGGDVRTEGWPARVGRFQK